MRGALGNIRSANKKARTEVHCITVSLYQPQKDFSLVRMELFFMLHTSTGLKLKFERRMGNSEIME